MLDSLKITDVFLKLQKWRWADKSDSSLGNGAGTFVNIVAAVSWDILPRPRDLQITRVAFQIDSLFPIILLGIRLHYRQNVGTHLEAARPRHIKANARSRWL